jgi:hypothetical protein
MSGHGSDLAITRGDPVSQRHRRWPRRHHPAVGLGTAAGTVSCREPHWRWYPWALSLR